ncbi:TldD/PmbA family protein [Chloroflexota bacterium]
MAARISVFNIAWWGENSVEQILKLARKSAEAAEVYHISSEQTVVSFETNKLKQVKTRQRTGFSLRVIKKGRLGFARGTSPENLPQLVKSALETAVFGQKASFEMPAAQLYEEIAIYDSAAEHYPVAQMVEMGKRIIEPVLARFPEVVCEASVACGVYRVRLANTNGGGADFPVSAFSVSLEGTVINGTDMLFVGESASSVAPIADPDAVSNTVIRQLELAANIQSIPSRQMPVIFTPNGLASALISPLAVAFNGKNVLQGASPLGERLGVVVFDDKFTLKDNPLIPGRPSSRPCDDEAVASRVTTLIENGRVNAFFYDLQTAGQAGINSTGNGGRGGGGLPSPAPSAFVIAPSETSFEAMLRDMGDGIVIEQVMGAEQGNILGGDFSGNVLLGFRVENGEITGRVKDTMISGNVYHLLKEITALGNKSEWVGGFLQAPHIYCPSLSVSSKG